MFEIMGEDQARVSGLLGLLGDPAGLELAAEGGRVAITADSGTVRSQRLRECLREMIDAEVRTARVDVNTVALAFGGFGKWQKFNAVNAMGFETGAPGVGSVIAIHETWENYRAWQSDGSLGQYGPAHAAALEVERTVAEQLTGRQGGRVAAGRFKADPIEGYVLDYETHFVVFSPKQKDQWENGRLSAKVHGRKRQQRVTLAGVRPGEQLKADRLTDIVSFLKAQPQATAMISGQRTAEEAPELSSQRAAAVRNAVIVALKEDSYAADTGIELDHDRSKGPGADLGGRRAWTSPHGEMADDPGVQIEISAPA